jgi:hypothetical protein
MKATKLYFVKQATVGDSTYQDLWNRVFLEGRRAVNQTEWRGKEPRSCAVTNLACRSTAMREGTPMLIDIEVSYRPKGYISYECNERYDGWTLIRLDRRNDGVLLDGNGEILKDGEPPVYLPFRVFPDAEFNDLDFGDFVEEIEVDDVVRTNADAVLEQVKASGKFSASMQGTFVASRRLRPMKKIILSNAPNGELTDGFGTQISNINLSTPHLEQVLMDRMAQLMREFVEGKASIKNLGNDDVVFVELSDSLVDCSPNEDGLDSWFAVLHYYTPIGFLEDLAKRLASEYRIEVSIVEGKNAGLVLRHEKARTLRGT